MLPLAGSQYPDSHADLAEALILGLARLGVTPRDIRVEGGTFPNVETFRLDVTGTQLARTSTPITFSGPMKMPPGAAEISVDQIAIEATPIFFEELPLQLHFWASRAGLALAHDKSNEPMLVFSKAAAGEVTLSTEHGDLEMFAHRLAVAASAKQGIEIKKTTLELTGITPRKLAFKIEITAKMFIMTAAVVVSGNIQIDDQLNARLSDLACSGDGMIASAANALLKPQLQKLETRDFALLAFTPGEVKLHDIIVEAQHTIRLRGSFGA